MVQPQAANFPGRKKSSLIQYALVGQPTRLVWPGDFSQRPGASTAPADWPGESTPGSKYNAFSTEVI